MYLELARKTVRRTVNIVELDGTMYPDEEQAIDSEPPPALRDKPGSLMREGLGAVKSRIIPRRMKAHLIWHICNGVRRLDTAKNPPSAAF